jgi:hypothetical protein
MLSARELSGQEDASPNQRIDGVALPAAVRVVDAIALIVAAQER